MEKPVEIVSITFEEKYPAATFEFFATNTTECGKTGTELINGTRAEINQKTFKNGGSYYCYGLRITKLGDGKKYGDLASLSKFRFKGMRQKMIKCRNSFLVPCVSFPWSVTRFVHHVVLSQV